MALDGTDHTYIGRTTHGSNRIANHMRRPPKLMAKHLRTDRPPREQIQVTYIATNITAADAKYIEATSIARDRPTCNVLPCTPLTCRKYWAMHYSKQKQKKALS